MCVAAARRSACFESGVNSFNTGVLSGYMGVVATSKRKVCLELGYSLSSLVPRLYLCYRSQTKQKCNSFSLHF